MTFSKTNTMATAAFLTTDPLSSLPAIPHTPLTSQYVSEGEPLKYEHQRPLDDAILYNVGDLIGVAGPIIAPGRFRDGGIEGAKEVSGKD
ncbi:hypothetical protein BGZ95_001439 [Linnemannia exigua]|uniref:Uncharacterized protein n=1 Tax=Linnemannia exigua TaxID=604196 RepID=A0AAD4D6W4_9FUNG|nr:hypothetical protein BGZ95_001439 [Linnemannia exigua]